MKQLYQDVKNGNTIIKELPKPACKKKHVLIKTSKTLISSGTERMLVDFGKSSYLNKAKKQPEKVKMVLKKAKTDGVFSTLESIKAKLDQPMQMGYSNVGTVIEVGHDVKEFKVGDRVVSNGNHAEIVCVSKNLVAKIPKQVSDTEASFAVVGSIALQGVRLANPTIGEHFVVMGLGLIGLLTVQILKANGCNVLGFDFDSDKVELAKSYGVDAFELGKSNDPLTVAKEFSSNDYIDGVIITASTDSNEPIHNAANMLRKKGRIILIGVVGLDIQRNDFYEKEISFMVSCSYGPGRYDQQYEEEGNDYPIGYVRWTEKRNFKAVLDLIDKGAININSLVSETFNFIDAKKAYEKLLQNKQSLGILLNFENESVIDDITIFIDDSIKKTNQTSSITLGMIGAGNYAGSKLIPAIKKTNVILDTITSSQGTSGTFLGKRFGFLKTSTENLSIIDDENINTVFIATQHNSHAELVIKSLNKNKNIFVEKPLAINSSELNNIVESYTKSRKRGDTGNLMVGYNRRFAPLVSMLKNKLNTVEPISISYLVNAGFVGSESWIQDKKIGGGRIIGEACHFIDLCRFIASSPIVDLQSLYLENEFDDSVLISLKFSNGSIASIQYVSNGHKSYPKERIEVFQSGNIAIINNFKNIKFHGFNGAKNKNFIFQNKGQKECIQTYINSIKTGADSPISFEELVEVSKFTIMASRNVKN